MFFLIFYLFTHLFILFIYIIALKKEFSLCHCYFYSSKTQLARVTWKRIEPTKSLEPVRLIWLGYFSTWVKPTRPSYGKYNLVGKLNHVWPSIPIESHDKVKSVWGFHTLVNTVSTYKGQMTSNGYGRNIAFGSTLQIDISLRFICMISYPY